MKVELVASVFVGPWREGDFSWMIEPPEWAGALFVFNVNAEQLHAWRRDPAGTAG